MAGVENNSKKVFFSGVLLLSLSTLLVKVIGLIYKIPMLSYLGSEGMGYFNSAYEIYALFCIIATAGLPVALSVLISGALARGQHALAEGIYRAALKAFVFIGGVGTLVMWLFAHRFCAWIGNTGAAAALRSIAPTVFLICISSALRGYFQGFQRMLPTAVSQLLESLGKLVFGLLFARMALENGQPTETVAAAAGWGLSLGSGFSMLYLLFEKKRTDTKQNCKREEEAPVKAGVETWRSLARLALPMTVGAALISVTKIVDMTMILRRLQSIGYTESAANEAFGIYTTLALSVFSVLPTLLNSVSLPLVPILSAAVISKNIAQQKQMIETSYRFTALFAVPVSLGVAAFSHPLLSLVFPYAPLAVETAAPLLSLLGASVFLSSMITATNSVLHAYRCVNLPILSMLAGILVKGITSYFFIGNPSIGLLGAPISSFLCNFVIVFLNFIFAASLSRADLSVSKIFFRPFGAATVSVGGALLIYRFFESKYGEGSVLSISVFLFCAALYLSFSVLFGSVTKEDLSVLPMGEKAVRFLKGVKSLIFKENRQKMGK